MKKTIVVLLALWVAFLFTLPTFSRTYTFEGGKTLSYSNCDLDDVCVAEWLQYNEDNPRKYITRKMHENGLDSELELLFAIIACESNWDTYAIGVNTNRTKDLGLFQINDVHGLANEFRFDYKLSTDWAISKRLRDGSWTAWSCLEKVKRTQ